jgi:hypothetical protein
MSCWFPKIIRFFLLLFSEVRGGRRNQGNQRGQPEMLKWNLNCLSSLSLFENLAEAAMISSLSLSLSL